MACSPAGGEQTLQLLTHVAVALTDLWQQHARSSRLALPILRTAEVLLSQTQILAHEPDQTTVLGEDMHRQIIALGPTAQDTELRSETAQVWHSTVLRCLSSGQLRVE